MCELSIPHPKPERLSDIDWTATLEMARICLDESGADSDNDHYLYEVVMVAVYGPDCWEWINQQF